MTDFYIELIEVVNETFKQSFDEYVVGFEAGWFCEDEMKTTICIDVEEAIRVKLKDKYKKISIETQKAAIETQKAALKKFMEDA